MQQPLPPIPLNLPPPTPPPPQWYPHYMNKPDKSMFKSESILGELYDRIQLPSNPLAAAAAASHPACDDLLLRLDSPHFCEQVPLALATRLQYENDLMKCAPLSRLSNRQSAIQAVSQAVSQAVILPLRRAAS